MDDDAAVREALADLIEVFGFRSEAFDSGEGFLAAHEPGRFACLISDLNLRGDSGLQLLQRLKALEPSLPVIVVSAQADVSTRARVLRSGALAYLPKPINDQDLLRRLAAALGRAPR